MQRRKFSRVFKIEAVRLIKDRGVAVAQAARDLDLHENVLRERVRELSIEADRKVKVADVARDMHGVNPGAECRQSFYAGRHPPASGFKPRPVHQ